MIIIYCTISLLLGGALGYLFANSKVSKYQTKVEMLEENIARQALESEKRMNTAQTEADERMAAVKADAEMQFRTALRFSSHVSTRPFRKLRLR